MYVRHIVAYLTGMRLMPRAGMPERTGWDGVTLDVSKVNPAHVIRMRHRSKGATDSLH
ncbi:hypothetical protein IG631_00717 [Alternaria alternata]|nr:hypothetical protein IG631_00717 [Alternaria alternata]